MCSLFFYAGMSQTRRGARGAGTFRGRGRYNDYPRAQPYQTSYAAVRQPYQARHATRSHPYYHAANARSRTYIKKDSKFKFVRSKNEITDPAFLVA